MSVAFLILDTETGGVDRNNDGICQTVAVLYEPATGSRQILMNARSKPRRPMAAGAIAVHGVTNEMCDYHPADGVVMMQLKMLIEYLQKELAADGIQMIFSGYNSQKFDMPFMDNVLEEKYFQMFTHVDAMRLIKRLYPDLKNHKLATVYSELLGKDPTGAHDAAFDCLMVADVLEFIQQKHNADWLKVADSLEGGILLRVMPSGKHKDMLFTALPDDYLQWIVKNFDKGDDARFTAIHELQRRGVTI